MNQHKYKSLQKAYITEYFHGGGGGGGGFARGGGGGGGFARGGGGGGFARGGGGGGFARGGGGGGFARGGRGGGDHDFDRNGHRIIIRNNPYFRRYPFFYYNGEYPYVYNYNIYPYNDDDNVSYVPPITINTTKYCFCQDEPLLQSNPSQVICVDNDEKQCGVCYPEQLCNQCIDAFDSMCSSNS